MKRTAGVVAAVILMAATSSGQQSSGPGRLSATALPLRLVGIAKDTSTPARSAVLIQCGEPQERRSAWLFAAGDRACDVAEVLEVLEDGAVVRNLLTGQRELLAMSKSSTPSTLPAPLPNDAHAEGEPAELPAPIVQPVATGVVAIELRKDLLDRSMANLPEVLTSALATPRHATGASGTSALADGYEMSNVKPGGIFDQLGLRDGDVLLEFNGQKLDGLAAVAALLGQVQGLSGAKMTVLRNGSKMTFVFTVR
jgi:general secretion pathway protein C